MNTHKSLLSISLLFLLVLRGPVQAQVNTENLRRTDLTRGFSGMVSLNFGLVEGNSEFLNLETGLRTDYLSQNYYMFGVIRYQRKLQNNTVFIHKGFIHLRGIRKLTRRFYGEVFTQKEFNDFILLNSRNLLGVGLRINLSTRTTDEPARQAVSLYAGTGAMWENEEIDTSPPSDESIIRTTNYISLNWRVDERMYLGVVTYYQLDLGDTGDYRVLLESGFGFDVTRFITFQMTFNLRYDHEPPSRVKTYDLELSNGLRFTF